MSYKPIAVSYLTLLLCLSTVSSSSSSDLDNQVTPKPKKAFFGYQPIKSTKVAYGACNEEDPRLVDCDIKLLEQVDVELINATSCSIRDKAACNDCTNNQDYELYPLNDKRMLFTWSLNSRAHDTSDQQPYFVLYLVDMRDCSFERMSVSLNTSRYSVIAYGDSFDLYFQDKSLCADKMCGQTHDLAGKLINGPVASYMPVEFDERNIYLCPVKPGSSVMGHFLLSSKLRLISSRYGEIKELMDYPSGDVSIAFSCDNEFFGFCWVDHRKAMHVNCRQFDSQGNLVLNSKNDLGYRVGGWMSMKNSKGGGLLLQTSVCNDDSWCADNIDRLSFHASRVQKDGQAQTILESHDLDCSSSVTDLKTSVNEWLGGYVCVMFLCYRGGDVTSVRLDSKCTSTKSD